MAELIIIILGIAADQLSKAWVSANLYGRSVTILEGVLDYSYVESTGAAFGMLGENTALLAVFSGLMSAVLIYILLRYRKMFSRLSNLSLALIVAGAVGNFIDRAFHGFVVDFIEFKFMNFAVFNIADICVTMGTILLVMALLFLEADNFEKFEQAEAARKQKKSASR